MILTKLTAISNNALLMMENCILKKYVLNINIKN